MSSRRESDCGSMPGAEEMCREESNSYDNDMDYSLSSDINDGDATSGTNDYEMYGLGGSDQNGKRILKLKLLKITLRLCSR